ncbi:hypothetical protein KKI24_30155 [bacterium]|nr:hypothetical protein [bacterium]
MNEKKVHQGDRIGKIKDFNTSLRKTLACISHRKYEIAKNCFEEAVESGLEIVRDNNQFYVKEIFQTYHRYYAAFKRIKYDDGAKWCLLNDVTILRRLKIPKEKKTRLIVSIIKKYEASGGDMGDIKAKWQNPAN